MDSSEPMILLNAVTILQANHVRGRYRLLEYFSKLDSLPTFAREDAGPDILFEANYSHVGGAACGQCSKKGQWLGSRVLHPLSHYMLCLPASRRWTQALPRYTQFFRRRQRTACVNLHTTSLGEQHFPRTAGQSHSNYTSNSIG